ncbi:zinc finger protein 507 [Hyla sarda]|uniref:zinc finger protein 507 n=1 Tax=Hyla sarda TaxID=327740 RepID=UPI0024C2F61B|nr:zinc finger protein 507 [Hyla sarda]XP_056381629.1 zinc finger protein 507 [Hyla sarda]XP_056381630.1 zinc finger protein 507 [Hyla sarda]
MEGKESGGTRIEEGRTLVPDARITLMHTVEDKQKSNEPLINVIQKLTAMVKSQESSRNTEVKKRPYPDDVANVPPSKEPDLANFCPKRVKERNPSEQAVSSPAPNNKKVMFYQCSLCKFISPSFEILTTHVKNHGQHNEIILMCSECHLTFKTHSELEIHIKTHCENEVSAPSQAKDQPREDKQVSQCSEVTEPVRKKWYAYEAYGLYRCLICRYTCGQQRMLKTHAWKHAGEVDFSYPIFEEENESAGLPDSTVAHTPQGSESVLSENIYVKQHVQVSGCDPVQEHSLLPVGVQIKRTDVLSQTSAPTPMTEVVVVDEALSENDQDNLIRESLLSSAQKIISCSQNTKGHVNVIVERLPGAEEAGPQKPFLISTEVDVKKKMVPQDSQEAGSVEVYHADKNAVEGEEIIIGFEGSDENSPPVRRRTNSECLRLHSLAAEALVTMPIRLVECPKTSFRLIREPNSINPDTGQGDGGDTVVSCPTVESSNVPEENDDVNQKEVKERGELTEAPMKMGISMSLLKVIEKLRERTDQNATDEDILKELQDNAQSECTNDLSSGSNLVEYLPNAERPYRCRLCHYTSDNKGYIKQHLRVHRQRQPYQCPICEHIAENSSDLENHMINHCKTMKYECKHCSESFYYKSQLRNHEREHHSVLDAMSTTSEDTQVCTEDVEEKLSPEDNNSSISKLYQCDVCSYTSSTYVGVRNHRRIHTSDKPYRCSLCGYVCSHPPSLKSHMWKHASDQNYNYEQVNKAINEAMSQSSRIQTEPLNRSLDESSMTLDSDPVISAAHSTPEVTYIENQKVNALRHTLCNTEKLQSQLRPGTELCVLLFCCCICGFESTSKELLMEHMKAHEGEIINIILNKSETTS